MTDRDRLERLITALDASVLALERPVCWGWVGDWQITGKHGHVMATDESTALVRLEKRLGFAAVTQDGDEMPHNRRDFLARVYG
jgi:hypothetical protein